MFTPYFDNKKVMQLTDILIQLFELFFIPSVALHTLEGDIKTRFIALYTIFN